MTSILKVNGKAYGKISTMLLESSASLGSVFAPEYLPEFGLRTQYPDR